MYIIIETIPQNGDDYINIEIGKGDMMYHNCLETECNIYVKQTWKDVYLFLKEKFNIIIVEPSGDNIQIDYFVDSKEFTIKEW